MSIDKQRIAAVFAYCGIVAALFAVIPWIDWQRHGSAWVANLAALPVLPVLLLLRKKHRFS